MAGFFESNVQMKQQKQHWVGLHIPGQHSISLFSQVLFSAMLHFISHFAFNACKTIIETGVTVTEENENNNM